MADTHRFTPVCYAGGQLSPALVSQFQQAIRTFHQAHPRPMPWRETRDPYRILVSEVMLQQTQVERVKPKYEQFLAAFPTAAALAEAPLGELLAVWQGLGYNRRAIALQRCCREVVTRFGARFPTAPEELQSLPGIGPYTAGALAAFAFGRAVPLIETNIRTVFIHCFFADRPTVDDREIMPLVAATLDQADPRSWYYGLMDYGAMLKRSHPNPGRRSAHHTRQSPFKGSNRELRSRMLAMVMSRSGTTVAAMVAELGAEYSAVERNLQALQREGFVVREGEQVCLRQDQQ